MGMEKVRSILFIIVVAVVCFAVLGNIAYSKITSPSDEPVESTLEGRELEFIPEFSLGSFNSREYQDHMEQALADKVPARPRVLLANASVQRALITAANTVCGYPAYPTFFGSRYVYCPSVEAVYQAPVLASSYNDAFFERTGEAVARTMRANPDLNWVYILPDRANISVASPAHDLVANNIDYPLAVQKLKAHLPAGCTFVTCSYSDISTYIEKFFKTDHHMQISGAFDFYSALVSAFGKKPVDSGATYLVADDYRGANARLGLVSSLTDELWDIEYETEGLSVRIQGKDADLSKLDAGVGEDATREYQAEDAFSNTYAEWFAGDYGLAEIHNDDPTVAGESLLVLGDSFDNNQLLLYAQNYEYVYSIDPRHYEGDIQEFIDAHPDITDAAFTMSLNNLDSFAKRQGIEEGEDSGASLDSDGS